MKIVCVIYLFAMLNAVMDKFLSYCDGIASSCNLSFVTDMFFLNIITK